MEIQSKIRKAGIFTITRCFRSLSNHPFLVCLLCFFIFLQRLSPFLFSFLISISPVLVSTALLLGTLLSFGQPNYPEIETEEVIQDRAISFEAKGAEVFQETDGYSEKGEDEGGISSEQLSLLEGKIEIHRAYFSDDNASLIDEKVPKVDLLGNEESFSDEEIVENHYVLVPANDEHLDLDDESSSSETDSVESERQDYVGLPCSPSLSSQRKVEEEEGEEEEEEEEWDSESDRAESSSPDASMVDIMSMLHDLNPLLGEESLNQVHESFDSVMGMTEDLEVGEDDSDEEETKPVVTWTEEDQKNLLDLGNSENQRNVRLENLILRINARKMHERNLIDLEGFDLPFNLSPIVTTRRNPFDLLHDPDEPPPVPGSAPSILLSRQNPFDNRYDSSQKQNLMEDGSQGDSAAFKSRESFLRRRAHLAARPSVFAPGKQERQVVELTPYFVPQDIVSNEPSNSLFQRQLSEVSDSNVSSVPEAESIGSVEDLDDSSLIDEDNEPILEPIVQEVTEEENELITRSREISNEDMQWGEELIYKIDHVSVGHGSQCSEDEDDPPKYHVEESNVEFQIGDVAVERGYSRVSSSSSLSEASERVFTETDGQWPSFLDRRRENSEEEPHMSTWAFEESTNLSVANEVIHGPDSTELREPVYDLSPRAVRILNLMSSSISSNVHAEPNNVLLEGSGQDMQDNVSNVAMLIESATLVPVDENESGLVDVSDTIGLDVLESDLSGVDKRSESQCASTGPGVSAVLQPHIEASFKENLTDPNAEGELIGENIPTLVKPSDICSPDGRRESDVHENHDCKEPFESQLREECSSEHERTTENSKSHLQSPNPVDLILTLAEENATLPSCNPAVGGPILEDQDCAPETNMQQVQELANNTISDEKFPLNRDFITTPPTAFEASSHAKLQKIVEEGDEIKDIDKDILSELDSIGDFSTKQRGFITNELGEHADFIGESLYTTHHTETGYVNIFEFNSVEMNAREEHAITSVSSDRIDMYNEDNSGPFETRTTGLEDISDAKFNERDGQVSTGLSTYEDELTSNNDIVSVDFEMDHNLENIRDAFSRETTGVLAAINLEDEHKKGLNSAVRNF